MNDFTTTDAVAKPMPVLTFMDILTIMRGEFCINSAADDTGKLKHLITLLLPHTNNFNKMTVIIKELKVICETMPTTIPNVKSKMIEFISQYDPTYKPLDTGWTVGNTTIVRDSDMSMEEIERMQAIIDGDEEEIERYNKKLGIDDKEEVIPTAHDVEKDAMSYLLDGLDVKDESLKNKQDNAPEDAFSGMFDDILPVDAHASTDHQLTNTSETKVEVTEDKYDFNAGMPDMSEFDNMDDVVIDESEFERIGGDMLKEAEEYEDNEPTLNANIELKSEIKENVVSAEDIIAKKKNFNFGVESTYKSDEESNDKVNTNQPPVPEAVAPEDNIEDEGNKLNVVVEEMMSVDDFDKFIPPVVKKPNPSFLAKYNGSRLERIKEYRKAHKTGRRLYLPESGYDVFVYEMQDRQQINYIYTLLENSNFGANMIEEYERDEFIRVICEHVDFYFPLDCSVKDFLFNLSPSDFNLIVLLFATINSNNIDDATNHAYVKVDRCSCPKCGNKMMFEEPINVDLYDAFSKTYPYGLFLKTYKKYQEKNPYDIVTAFRSTKYGKLYKLSSSDEVCKYEIIISRPTMGKIQSINKFKHDILYSQFKEAASTRQDLLAEIVDVETLNSILEQCETFIDFKEYVNTFTSEYMDNPEVAETPEVRKITATIKYIGEQLEAVEENNLGMLTVTTWVDMLNITSIESDVGIDESFDHEDVSELYKAVIDVPAELITELVKIITDINAKEGDQTKAPVIKLNKEFLKEHLGFYKTYYNDEEAELKYRTRLESDGEEVTDAVIAKYKKLRGTMKTRMDEGMCAVCASEEADILYPQLLFFSIASKSNLNAK